MTDSDLDRAAASIGAARRLTVLTGAGVSAASGVPTFRGASGLWHQHRAEDLATPGRLHAIRPLSGSGTTGVED